jgi:integrase
MEIVDNLHPNMIQSSPKGGMSMKGYIEYFDDGACRVRFGRKIQKRFKSGEKEKAERFLTGLRFKSDENTLDVRDYSNANPLSIGNQAKAWLKTKLSSSKSHYRNLERWMDLAVYTWKNRNVKTIGFSDLQDLIDSQSISDKTKHDMADCYHQFFKWLNKREKIPIPDIPEYKFTLGWREIIDLDTQAAIIDEVRRIAPYRIWLGIKWLATYISIRPAEMRALREKDVNLNGMIICRPQSTKEKKPKIVPMVEEDIALVKGLPASFPEMYFFRWENGKQIDIHAFYRWWKKACASLGVEGVDLYGGTRHSSTTAMAAIFSKEELKKSGTMHGTNKAFDRYCQGEAAPSLNIYNKLSSQRAGRHLDDIKRLPARS